MTAAIEGAELRRTQAGSPLEVLRVFLRLGLTSFGGPIAHIGYFREEFVVRRRWLDERAFVDLVALCQFLPGPASSQVGFSIGLMRGGYLGGLAAWTGFTLPSAILLVLFAYGASALTGTIGAGQRSGACGRTMPKAGSRTVRTQVRGRPLSATSSFQHA